MSGLSKKLKKKHLESISFSNGTGSTIEKFLQRGLIWPVLNKIGFCPQVKRWKDKGRGGGGGGGLSVIDQACSQDSWILAKFCFAF